MKTEKLSRPANWIVTMLAAMLAGIVFDLLIPYPPDAPKWVLRILSSLHHWVLIAAVLLLTRNHLRFPPRRLIMPEGRFSPLKALSYGLIWLASLAAFALVKYVLKPALFLKAQDYRFLSPMLMAILLFTPVQTFSEELVFRCMLSRIAHDELPAGRGRMLAWSLVSGGAFMLFHIGNPIGRGLAALKALAFYFILGAFLMWLSLSGRGFEPAFGIHMANNLFLDTVLCRSDSFMISNPMFLFTGDETYLIITELLFCMAVTAIFHPLLSKRSLQCECNPIIGRPIPCKPMPDKPIPCNRISCKLISDKSNSKRGHHEQRK